MAIIKISELPPGDSTLTADDVFPVVDFGSSSTKRVTIGALSDLLNSGGVIDSAGTVTIITQTVDSDYIAARVGDIESGTDSAGTIALITETVDSDYINGLVTIPAGFDSADALGAVTSGDLDMAGNKVLFANVYSSEGDLPDAGQYHGMFAHVHGTGAGYFAHAGQWTRLANQSELSTVTDIFLNTKTVLNTNPDVYDDNGFNGPDGKGIIDPNGKGGWYFNSPGGTGTERSVAWRMFTNDGPQTFTVADIEYLYMVVDLQATGDVFFNVYTAGLNPAPSAFLSRFNFALNGAHSDTGLKLLWAAPPGSSVTEADVTVFPFLERVQLPYQAGLSSGDLDVTEVLKSVNVMTSTSAGAGDTEFTLKNVGYKVSNGYTQNFDLIINAQDQIDSAIAEIPTGNVDPSTIDPALLDFTNVPVGAGGVDVGKLYRTANGILMIKLPFATYFGVGVVETDASTLVATANRYGIPVSAPAGLGMYIPTEFDIRRDTTGLGNVYYLKDYDAQAHAGITYGNDAIYVDSINGDDLNSGLTSAAPKKTMKAAQVLTPSRIYLAYGSTFEKNERTLDISYSVEIIAYGDDNLDYPRITAMQNNRVGTWTQTNNYYSTVMPDFVGIVRDLNFDDGVGGKLGMTAVSTIADVNSTPNSYLMDWAGNEGPVQTLYIRFADDRSPEGDTNYELHDNLALRIRGSNRDVYFRNIEVDKGLIVNGEGGMRVFMDECIAAYTAWGTDEMVIYRGIMRSFDGDACNIDDYNGTQGNVYEIEIDGTNYNAGDTSSQASTTHNTSNVVRIGGYYHDTSGQCVADVQAAGETWMAGCTLQNSGSNTGSYFQVEAYIERCTFNNFSTVDIQVASGGTVYHLDNRSAPGLLNVDNNGTYQPYP